MKLDQALLRQVFKTSVDVFVHTGTLGSLLHCSRSCIQSELLFMPIVFHHPSAHSCTQPCSSLSVTSPQVLGGTAVGLPKRYLTCRQSKL